MRKNVVYATLPASGEPLCLDFYYRADRDGQYLFSCPYRKCIHLYFADGKSFQQLRKRRDWLRNRKLAMFVEGRLRGSLRRYLAYERKVHPDAR